MSVNNPPLTGQLNAVSAGPISPGPGTVVSLTLKTPPEQQAQIIISGAYQGLQIVIEARDPGQLAPWYGTRSVRQDTGTPIWGLNAIQVPDNPQGANASWAVVAAIEGAGFVRVRCVGLGNGTPSIAIIPGSFFASSPVPTSSAGQLSQTALLVKILRAIEHLTSIKSGAWVATGVDDGSYNTVVNDPSLGDWVG